MFKRFLQNVSKAVTAFLLIQGSGANIQYAESAWSAGVGGGESADFDPTLSYLFEDLNGYFQNADTFGLMNSKDLPYMPIDDSPWFFEDSEVAEYVDYINLNEDFFEEADDVSEQEFLDDSLVSSSATWVAVSSMSLMLEPNGLAPLSLVALLLPQLEQVAATTIATTPIPVQELQANQQHDVDLDMRGIFSDPTAAFAGAMMDDGSPLIANINVGAAKLSGRPYVNDVSKVVADGDLAFALSAGSVDVFNISIPGDKRYVTTYPFNPIGRDIYAENSILYVVDLFSLRTINFQDVMNPVNLDSFSLSGFGANLMVKPPLAYVATSDNVQFVNVSNSSSLTSEGSIEGLSNIRAIAEEDGITYVARYDIGVQAFNTTNLAAPVELDTFSANFVADVKVRNHTLLLTALSPTETLRKIDAHDPGNLTQTGSVDLQSGFAVDFLDDARAVVADNSLGVREVDIQASLTVTGTLATSDVARSIFINGADILVAGRHAGFFIIDGNTFTFLNEGDAAPWLVEDLALQGSDLLVMATYEFGMQNVYRANPQMPTLVGGIEVPGADYVHGVCVQGDTAFNAEYTSGLRSLDNSQPQTPVSRGRYNSPGRANNCLVSGSRVYIADDDAVIAADASSADPTFLGSLPTPGNAFDMIERNSTVFIADNGFGLLIGDFNRPDAPFARGNYSMPQNCYDIAFHPGYDDIVLLVAGRNFLSLNVSNLDQPQLVFDLDVGDAIRGVMIKNFNVAILSGQNGMHYVNITQPNAMHTIGFQEVPGNGYRIIGDNNTIYYAAYNGGLQSFNSSLARLTANFGVNDIGLYRVMVYAINELGDWLSAMVGIQVNPAVSSSMVEVASSVSAQEQTQVSTLAQTETQPQTQSLNNTELHDSSSSLLAQTSEDGSAVSSQQSSSNAVTSTSVWSNVYSLFTTESAVDSAANVVIGDFTVTVAEVSVSPSGNIIFNTENLSVENYSGELENLEFTLYVDDERIDVFTYSQLQGGYELNIIDALCDRDAYIDDARIQASDGDSSVDVNIIFTGQESVNMCYNSASKLGFVGALLAG